MKILFKKGFTLIELLTVLGIMVVLIALSVPFLRSFQHQTDLDNTAEIMINNLRLARSKTLASEGLSSYGVYFTTSTSPHQFVLYKGTSYEGRDTSFDDVHSLPANIEIQDISLGGSTEVTFSKIFGESLQEGNIIVTLVTNPSKQRSVYIENSGAVSTFQFSVPSDSDRIKDSRHIHLDYSRTISTSSETVTLTSGAFSQVINLADYIEDDQVYWDGEFEVGGQMQKLIIATHRLNSPDTQWSIHRDKRYNNAVLEISLSGDSSGSIVQYQADGSSTTKSSIYATDASWQ